MKKLKKKSKRNIETKDDNPLLIEMKYLTEEEREILEIIKKPKYR